MNPEIRRFFLERDWVKAIVEEFGQAVAETRARGAKVFHVSLAGGSTPEPIYRSIAGDAVISALSAEITIHLWVGDERDVPPADKRRNGFAIEAAFQWAGAWRRPPTLHLWPSSPRAQSCEEYARDLRAAMGDKPRFDLAILGLGSDGHTAGIFETGEASRQDAPLAICTTAPAEPKNRMSLGAPVLRDSRKIIVAARGTEKRKIIEKIARGDTTPLSLIVADRGMVFYLEEA